MRIEDLFFAGHDYGLSPKEFTELQIVVSADGIRFYPELQVKYILEKGFIVIMPRNTEIMAIEEFN